MPIPERRKVGSSGDYGDLTADLGNANCGIDLSL